MALQIRRGTDSDRSTQIANFKAGELIYTTDNKELWVAAGGSVMTKINAVKSVNTQTGDVVLTTDQVAQGATNKYYSSTLTRTDAGAALVGGNAGNTGITFNYNSGTNTISAVVSAGGYALPIATGSQLGGVKISAGGLQIDGGGLVSLITPVSTGTANQLTYYTGVNAVAQTGAGLTWSPSGNFFAGGLLKVTGTMQANRFDIPYAADNGLLIQTQSDGNANTEVFAVQSYHTSTTPTAVRFFRGRGTVASPTTITTGDAITDLHFVGFTGGSTAAIAGQIRVSATGTVSSGVVPGVMTLSAADASGTLVDTVSVTGSGVTITGNLNYSGLRISPANFITVSSTATYVLSSTKHKNILLVTAGSLTATLTMPANPVDGQLCIISVQTNNVTLALTAGPTLSGTFAGAVPAPTTFEYIYRASNTTWYKIQ
jgi:hypothetical protein